ncbi:MAG: hypothetical protein ACI4EV_04710 [Lachnospiraceae bacterium]
MSVNGIGNSTATGYTAYDSKVKASGSNTEAKVSSDTEKAAVYEASSKKAADGTSVKTKGANAKLIAQMKADSNARIAQMQSLVEKMFSKQGITIGKADDMWKQLASGNFTADPETIAQAKEDISEDGYWGVKQTSDRIFDFAVALSGGDKEKMEQMKEAVEKGFKEATKTWGKELPSISNDTLKAVNDKFDKWFEEN